MTADIIDGKAAAAALRETIAGAAASMQAEAGAQPALAVVLVGDDPASQVYVRNKGIATKKAGMRSIEHRLPADASEADVVSLVGELNADDEVDGILVQLPLPDHIDSSQVINEIDPSKDVDGLTEANAGRLMLGKEGLVPCTPQGSVILAKSVRKSISGLNAVVVGRSILVGKPLAMLLLAENCTVTMAHSRTKDLADVCRGADILCAAVGRPRMIEGDWVKEGATVIDVGINRIEEDGKSRLVGDVDFESAKARAGAITPVPGGVGPMTIACLLRNTVIAAARPARASGAGGLGRAVAPRPDSRHPARQRFPDLEDAWRALEGRAERNIFLSWDWAATNIETSGADLYVIDVREGESVVALGLLNPIVERRHGFVRARQLRLNETGPGAGATLFAEGNGLLAAKGREAASWAAAVEALRESRAPLWDEIIVSGADPGLEAQAGESGLAIHRRAEHPSAFVDLAALRSEGADALQAYLMNLSANTRSQINRALKLYEEQGPLSVSRAASAEEALGFLDEIAKLHEAKWREKAKFNPAKQEYVFNFHRRLIARLFDKGGVELVRIAAGDAPFAWIYNLIENDRVLFYMGGFATETDNRLKPGLVAHALLIASHLKAGKETYDFLAGGDRYKFSLGESGPDTVEFAIQKMTPALRVEHALRSVKQLSKREP